MTQPLRDCIYQHNVESDRPITSIYLAGPVDLGTDVKWKELLVKALIDTQLKISIFDPASAFKTTYTLDPTGAAYIEYVNTKALNMADLVICSLPSNVQTVGTIVELDRCAKTKKEVWLMTDINIDKSVYLLNRIDVSKMIKLPDKSDKSIVDGIAEIVARLVVRRPMQ